MSTTPHPHGLDGEPHGLAAADLALGAINLHVMFDDGLGDHGMTQLDAVVDPRMTRFVLLYLERQYQARIRRLQKFIKATHLHEEMRTAQEDTDAAAEADAAVEPEHSA